MQPQPLPRPRKDILRAKRHHLFSLPEGFLLPLPFSSSPSSSSYTYTITPYCVLLAASRCCISLLELCHLYKPNGVNYPRKFHSFPNLPLLLLFYSYGNFIRRPSRKSAYSPYYYYYPASFPGGDFRSGVNLSHLVCSSLSRTLLVGGR